MAGNRDKCIAAGMTDYASKPLNARDLLRVFETWLVGGGDTARGVGRDNVY